MNEYDLLKAFRDERSEEAFAALVRRYAGLVYSVAKRRLANANLAEDITQIVFIRFAKTPPKVQSEAELAAWLHRTTVNVTIDTWRSESRRRNREKQTVVMEPTTPENTLWEELSPNLDETLNQLHDEDRQALVLRFFGQKTMRDVGAALGVSEDAAKMRVSRALDRMRTKLGVGGGACTAAVLESMLDRRSVQAAPVQLVSRLAAMKLPEAVGVAGMSRPLGAFLRASKFNLATGAVVLAVIVVSLVRLAQPSNEPTPEAVVPNSQTNLTVNPKQITRRERTGSTGLITPSAPLPKLVTMLFHVAEAESGAELADTRIHVVYYGWEGMTEVRDFLTDNNGIAAIPEPDDETKTQTIIVSVAAEGHVPKIVYFHPGEIPADYTMKLDQAMTASGVVVDDNGLPVAGVTIRIDSPGLNIDLAENVDFRDCPVTNRDDGSWSCSYIPKDYKNEIGFILKKPGYAVTIPIVPLSEVDLTNLVLVIDRGYTVTGQITDLQNRPVADARIKTLPFYDPQEQSASTDEHGVFSIEGVEDRSFWMTPPFETNENGIVTLHRKAGNASSHVGLAVQAEGFAPQTNTLELNEVTNVVNFTLSPGNIFRGRVVDRTGNPITNAVIRTDSDFVHQIATPLVWKTHTDGNGRFEWDSAPAYETCYMFVADGYKAIRGMPLLADGNDHEITLERDAIK